jgi:prepilin-type processing-associated H-X9-DG protein/prepilin-type N-terminal cleavage/methylation domain-containing protein
MLAHTARTDKRPAFTILELLVAVAIIGGLIAILFPALMAAREAARSMQCKNNLREIGVSMQQYHDATKRFPQAWKVAPDKVSGFGWAVALLPFLEESPLAHKINCDLPVSASQNEATRNTDLAIMRCPSDISESSFELLPEPARVHATQSTNASSTPLASSDLPLVRLPTANYVGVYGTLEADDTIPAPSGDGTIISDRMVRFADLQRGPSHTIIVGERPTSLVPSTWYGVNFKGEDAACRLVGAAISSPNCEPCDECEFGSRHSGGSNFAWADGHVTLVHSDIDRAEYQQLSMRRLR